LAQSPTLADIISQILSVPREAGTPAAEHARRTVSEHLQGLGYEVEVQRFSFSPASLNGYPLLGAGLGGLALLLFPLLASESFSPWWAVGVWFTGLASLISVAAGVGLGWVTLGGVRDDANLLATRKGITPRRWIVAHLDTKAQRQSMAGRLVSVWVLALTITALSGGVLARLWGPIPIGWLGALMVLSVGAGALAGRGRLHGTSAGTRDNSSGVVAALSAAAANRDPETGILITGAEEFGLVGARVFAKLKGTLHEVEFINLDTLDTAGRLYVVSHDSRGEQYGRTLQQRLSEVAVPTIQHRRLPWGILVDSAPLARAGGVAVTLGRLTWATLRRIHTPADNPDGFSFETAEQVGKAVVAN
jgi:hypothetical protein